MSERRFAILIASSRFPDDPKLEDLRCPENDVDGLNEILTSKDHGEFTDTFVLKNKPHHQVLRNIESVLNDASKEDLVLIYYSGHGKLDRAGRLHLATVDTEVGTLQSTSIPAERIRSLIDNSSCNKLVIILDCCYGGAVGKDFFKGDFDGQLQVLSSEGRGIYILSASTATQMATEKESDKYGLLTKHIIHGIKEGEADLNEDGRVSIADLYKYVQEKVTQESAQKPMHWGIDVFGELFIARSGKTPSEKRSKLIREMLFDLAKEGILPDRITTEAISLLNKEPEQLSAKDQKRLALLDALYRKEIGVGNFIEKWNDKVPPPPPPPIRRNLIFGVPIGLTLLLLLVVVASIIINGDNKQPPSPEDSRLQVVELLQQNADGWNTNNIDLVIRAFHKRAKIVIQEQPPLSRDEYRENVRNKINNQRVRYYNFTNFGMEGNQAWLDCTIEIVRGPHDPGEWHKPANFKFIWENGRWYILVARAR
jgi:hypothetical protein